MRDDYDFSDAESAVAISALASLTATNREKTRITINIDTDVLDAFRSRADALGKPYQPIINAVLRDYLAREDGEGIEATLRRVIREDLKPSAEA